MTSAQLRRLCKARSLSATNIKELFLGIEINNCRASGWSDTSNLGAFFTALGCTALTSLSIELWGPPKDRDYEYNFEADLLDYHLEQLLWQLKPTYTTLEALSIIFAESADPKDIHWMLDCAQQVDEFANFTTLKRLVLYERFLNGFYDWGYNHNDVPIQTQERLVRLLPPSLEELEIIAPTAAFPPWLKELLLGKEHYKNLRELVVHVSTKLNFWDEKYHGHLSVSELCDLSVKVWGDFCMADISVSIHCQDTDEWYPVA